MNATNFWRLRVHDSLPSTSNLCRDLAAAGEPEGLAVLALRQESGRASHGRAWASPAGNMYLSVLLRPTGPVRMGGRWSLLTAVALAGAVAEMLPGHAPLSLKWPNDLLLGGAKLAGILLDSAADAKGDFTSLVIGIGLNLAAAPAIPGRDTACIADFTPPPAPEAAAHAVLNQLHTWRDASFDAVRAAWLARAQPIGTDIALLQGDRTIAGRFAGLADDGALLLSVNGTTNAYAAGEVRLRMGTPADAPGH